MKSLPLLILIFIGRQAICQEESAVSFNGQQVVKPYWVSATDPKSGNTVISFFDEYHQLKYREELKNRIVKPDKHNARYLDKMLELVTGNQLLASRMNTIEFPGPLLSDENMVMSSESKILTNPLSRHFSILPRLTVKDNGNVFVYIFNPNRNVIEINLRDTARNSIHRDETASYYYGKLLNVSELSAGYYDLSLTCGGVAVSYQIRITAGSHHVDVRQIASF